MKNLTLLWVGLLGLLLFPLTAQSAQTWHKGCQTGAAGVRNVTRGSSVCVNSTAVTNSEMLYVGACENVDALFWEDTAGAGAGTSTVLIYSCHAPVDDNQLVAGTDDGPTDAGWVADGCFLVENTTLDGDATANTEAIYGFAAEWIYADTGVYGALDTPRLIIRCNP